MKKAQSDGTIILGAILAVTFFVFLFGSFRIIGAGERGVVLQFGAVTGEIWDEGLHFKMPIVQTVKKVDVRKQKIETDASASSKDLQIITSTIAINYRLNPQSVAWLYQNVGRDYQFKIIDPAIEESVKAATAEFTAEELITQRPRVRERIKINLKEKMSDITNGAIIIDELNIVNFDFSEGFNLAIEDKVTAEQRTLKAEEDLNRIKLEAQQQIELAKAEAESIKIQSEAIAEGQEILQLRWIEAWNGELPETLVIGEDNNLLIGLNSGIEN